MERYRPSIEGCQHQFRAVYEGKDGKSGEREVGIDSDGGCEREEKRGSAPVRISGAKYCGKVTRRSRAQRVWRDQISPA